MRSRGSGEGKGEGVEEGGSRGKSEIKDVGGQNESASSFTWGL